MTLPLWAKAHIGFDRKSRVNFDADEYFEDVRQIFGQALPDGIADLVQVSTTASSVEVLFERRSERAVLLWDVDFTERVDGLLALVFCDDGADANTYSGLGLAAYSNLCASIFLARDPAVAQFILKLASDFLPDSYSVTVEDDLRMDRYRRLIRAYVALHELAHILYRILPEKIPEIEERIHTTIANINPSQVIANKRGLSEVDQEFEEKGLLVRRSDLHEILQQITDHLDRPHDREEIWCDVFASEHFIGWALENGFDPQECVVADDLLHLILAGRIQWASFWDRRLIIEDWRDSDALRNHENRTNIRGLLLAATAAQAWHNQNPNQSIEDASEGFAHLVSEEGDELKKRFVDRNHFALGLLGGLDRQEMFELADVDWNGHSPENRKNLIEEAFDQLS